MKKVKLYSEFLNEAQLKSIKAGPESKVEVSDQKTIDGKVISAQEILGQIIAADTEDTFKAFFYDKYGSTKFDVETMSQMTSDYQAYYQEVAVDDKEEEKEGDKKEKEDKKEGGDDPLADLDI